jgi:hypothetical protein
MPYHGTAAGHAEQTSKLMIEKTAPTLPERFGGGGPLHWLA